MQDKIEEIKKQAEEKIKEIKNSQELQELKVKMLGKKSELSNLLKGLGKLSPEERPKVGALVNEARKTIEEKMIKPFPLLLFVTILSNKQIHLAYTNRRTNSSRSPYSKSITGISINV